MTKMLLSRTAIGPIATGQRRQDGARFSLQSRRGNGSCNRKAPDAVQDDDHDLSRNRAADQGTGAGIAAQHDLRAVVHRHVAEKGQQDHTENEPQERGIERLSADEWGR